MEYYLISDSLSGSSAADRLSFFLPFVPLILAWNSILIATSMTNPAAIDLRKKAGVVPATKWMTLKWRLFHLALAFFLLLYYWANDPESHEIFLNMSLNRFIAICQCSSTPIGAYIGLFLHYIVMPPLTVFIFAKSLTEVLCSRGIITSESIISKKFGGRGGLVQTISLLSYLILEFYVLNFVRFDTYEVFDFFYVIVFHYISSFLWVFRKTGYDFKQDVEEFNNNL